MCRLAAILGMLQLVQYTLMSKVQLQQPRLFLMHLRAQHSVRTERG